MTRPKQHSTKTHQNKLVRGLLTMKWLMLFLVFMHISSAVAQFNDTKTNPIETEDPNKQLANLLFEKNEYAKAAVLLEDLVNSNPNDEFLYLRYLTCLTKLGEQDKAIKWIKKRIKKSNTPIALVVDECWINTTYAEDDQKIKHTQRANELAELVIDQLTPRAAQQMGAMHIYIANRFEQHGLKNYAIQVLNAAELILGSIPEISNELAMLYMETGNREKGLEKYTNMMLVGMPFESIKPVFESHITDSLDYILMQRLLLNKIQEYPEITALSEGLKWTFLKQENWSAAFLYTKSLDKRLKENGTRVYELGILCYSNKQYSTATLCFDYCLSLKENCFDLPACQSALIDVAYDQTTLGNPTNEQVIQLKERMQLFELEYGPQEATLNNAIKLAQLFVRYNDVIAPPNINNQNRAENSPVPQKISPQEQAEALLNKYLNEGKYLKKTSLAKVKMALGDVVLTSGDVWSSELLFAQVEKDFKEEELGQFAKFKRAELSFYRGDFDWASMQLDVLKSATTQLISNDAMELALVIIDNLGIDSNYRALKWYGQALLFEKQHNDTKAWIHLDSVINEYPGHALSDEILFVKARIKKNQGRFEEAAEFLETLSVAFNFDILADNALYQLGMLYAYPLKNTEKAKVVFETLIQKYSSSIYIVDARREYRKIRGY